jgi:hypothetical protein
LAVRIGTTQAAEVCAFAGACAGNEEGHIGLLSLGAGTEG